MQIDVKTIRKERGMTSRAFAQVIGISESIYTRYEAKKELPSKYVFSLWQEIKDFPIPEDFFYYTSYTLYVNMKYHKMTQKEAAVFFDIANQSTMSVFLQDNIPMYEKKDYFLKFDPFIIPQIAEDNGSQYMFKPITDLKAKGNFILAEKRRIQKIRKMEEMKNAQ